MSVLVVLREDHDSEVALAAVLSLERRLDHEDDPEPVLEEPPMALPSEQTIETREGAGKHEPSDAVLLSESPDARSESDPHALLEDLERLAALAQAGHLTDGEFAEMKRRLLKKGT